MAMKKAKKPLPQGPEWVFDDLIEYQKVIEEVAVKEFGLDFYPNQLEIVTSEQMIDAYSTIGLPIAPYNHWRYGKYHSYQSNSYKTGRSGLAYEMVINSNPCISYLMENNNLVTQALVIAHACYGHNPFFKNNFLFKEWTQPDAIVDYCLFAREYINQCELKYGVEEVEKTLDAAHALEDHGVDKYKRPEPLSPRKEKELQEQRIEDEQKFIYEFWKLVPPPKNEEEEDPEECCFPKEPQENILYFLEKHSPVLKPWQREILRIVRKLAQYFYPQGQTKVSNEGFATFMHYEIIYKMFDLGYLTDGFMQNFLELHTNVVAQRDKSPLNPYYLGFNIYRDIKRICLEPTDEDYEWFPHLAGKEDWVKEVKYAAYSFKDESFILQYLSPHLIRKMRLFNVLDDSSLEEYHITHISNDDGYKEIRRMLSQEYNRAYIIPDVQVYKANLKTNRRLDLKYYPVNGIPLEHNDLCKVEEFLDYLWGFDTRILEHK
jgi:stage V sporulation protein R